MMTKVLKKAEAFLARFPRRLAWFPLAGATALLALVLFLIFPLFP